MHYSFNNIDFDKIDWVSLTKSLNIQVRDPREPVLLTIVGTPFKQYQRAFTHCTKLIEDPDLPIDIALDEVDLLYDSGHITSFDRACIKHYVKYILKSYGVIH